MQFSKVIGQNAVKEKLIASVNENRLAHTQLFLGPEGSGALPLAVAFAQYVNCQHKQNGDSCGVCPSCIKYQKFAHPDLHFVFPTNTNEKVKKEPKSSLFNDEFREYLIEHQGYITQNQWYEKLAIGNKQGTIYTRDADDIVKILGLKPYEAEYKVIIIYLAEKLIEAASNKLLKSLEEPPEKTLIILVAERYEMIIPTIRSRAQLVKIPRLADDEIVNALLRRFSDSLNEPKAQDIAILAQGNWNIAQNAVQYSGENEYNFTTFREWMRLCFKPRDYFKLYALIQELSRLGREKQKSFLTYGLNVVHNALLVNQKMEEQLIADDAEKDYFKNFGPFVNSANEAEIYKLLDDAVFHIERNANPGILFAHLSFRFIDLLKKGRAVVAKAK